MKLKIYFQNCFLAGTAVFLLQLTACRKLVEVDLPIDKVTSATVFTSDETAAAAVNGIYSGMMPLTLSYASGATTIYTALAGDELYLTNTTIPEQGEFYSNTLTPGNGTVWLDFWFRAYKYIYQANACIANLSGATTLTPAIKERLMGEALFLRAYHYFLLVNLFGDLPLVLSTEHSQTAKLPRAARSMVYEQILQDLQEAKRLLPATYAPGGRIRPNKWAAAALLSRIYLYQGNWSLAETEATAVIESGSYSLVPNPNNVFLANSQEAIWQLAPVEAGFNTTEARYLIPIPTGTNKPNFAVTPSLMASFEPGDTRKNAWISSKTIGTETFYFPFKYKVRNLNLPVTEYNMVLRLAEQFLIRAEARAQLGKLTEAKSDLNTLRARAGLTAFSLSQKEDVLTAIEKERRLELFAEGGHRWFDLKRTGRTDAVLQPLKPNWQSTDQLFPIPLSEILRNPALTQNPGY